MMVISVYPRDDISLRLVDHLKRRRPELKISDFPAKGSVLLTRGKVDFESGVVYVSNPMSFSDFKALFVEADPPTGLRSDVPISVCPDMFFELIELLILGEEVSVKNLKRRGCKGVGDFVLVEDAAKNVLREYPALFEGMERVARLVGAGFLSERDLNSWIVGAHVLKNIKLRVPKKLTPLSIIRVELPVEFSVDYGPSSVTGKPMAHIPLRSRPGQHGKLEVRLRVGKLRIDVAEVSARTEYKPLKPIRKMNRIRPSWGVCSGDLLIFWDGSLKALEVISGDTVWRLPLNVSGAVVQEDKLYAWTPDGSIHCISIDSGEIIWEERIGTRVNFACVSKDKLALMTVGGLLMYDLDPLPSLRRELKITGLLTCSEKALYIADGDSVTVLGWDSEIIGVLKFEDRVWDILNLGDLTVVAHERILESIDDDLKTVSKVKLSENVDSLHRWRDDLVVLTKSGRIVMLHPKTLKIIGEIEGTFKDVLACDWLYAIDEDGSVCVILAPER